MNEEEEARIKALEEEAALLNTKATALLALCIQQQAEICAITEMLEEMVAAGPSEPDDLMASLARDIEKARKSHSTSPLN